MSLSIYKFSTYTIPKTQKMVLDAPLLDTQHYKENIKGKVKKSRERSCAPPLHVGVEAIEKGAFGSLSTLLFFNNYYVGIYTITQCIIILIYK